MAEENGFLLSVEKAVRLRPQAPAYRAADGTTMTYGELWKLSDAIAAELAARTDDREPVVVWGTRHRSWWPVSWAA